MTTCARAVTVLRMLEHPPLQAGAEEMDDLLALGLAVEADPEDLACLHWLQGAVSSVAGRSLNDPQVTTAVEQAIAAIDKDLKNDWYLMTTGKAERTRREELRVTGRRALALLRDPHLGVTLRKLLTDATSVPSHVRYVCDERLGVEHYAITHKGARVRRALEVRLARFAEASLKSFVAQYDKTATKMNAFASNVHTIASNVGFVKKNREQVVIGLAKTGLAPSHALGAYHAGRNANQPADVAVTCARNASKFGGPNYAAQRLRQAEAALKQALAQQRIPPTPNAVGAAKGLLDFEPPAAGVPRLMELAQRLGPITGRGDDLRFKYACRLIPAQGTPAEVVDRVTSALRLLDQYPSAVQRGADARAAAVALASMVREPSALPGIVTRFRELERALFQSGLSDPLDAPNHALECVGAPGTPAEVVDTVHGLLEQLTSGRARGKGDVAIAVSFAKRFGY